MGLDRIKWKANRTLDICHFVKIATTLVVAIKLNGLSLKIFDGLRTWKYRLPTID